MKEKLIQLKAQLAALKERIEADDKDAIAEGVKLQGQIDETEKAIKQAEQKASLLNLIGKKEEENPIEEKKIARSLGENFVNEVKAKSIGKQFDIFVPAFKAATDVQMSPAGAVEYAATFDRNVVTAPRTPLVVRDLFGAEEIEGSTLHYLVEGAMEGEPAVTAEGAKKPQVHFADPEMKTVTLEKIPAYIKESEEYAHDYKFLASAVNGRLLYALGLKVQNYLVSDLLGTSGIQTGNITAAATYLDVAEAILQAAMDVQDGSGFTADAIAMNPTDWFQLRTLKLTTNEYFGGGPFGAQNVPNLWGIPVCITNAIAAKKFVIGAFKACGSVVTNGEGVSVRMTNTNEDDFIKNLMTILAEERLKLAIRRPAGFKVLTKATT